MAAPAATAAILTMYSLSPLEAHAKSAPSTNPDVVRKSIAELIETDMEKRGDGTSLIGTFVRLAWHCAGSFSKQDGSGGSNGARMRFDPEKNWGGNAGLTMARDVLEPIKVNFSCVSNTSDFSNFLRIMFTAII